jgi:glycosyltransferase involved in cell wall biosynthesis
VKVCILTPEFLPAWGGVGTYSYNLARGLRDRAEVHVLAGAAPRTLEGDVDGIQVHSVVPSRESRSNLSPVRFQVAVFRHLPRLARTVGFDLVHANHAYMSDLLVRLRRSEIPTVVTIHTTLDTQLGGTVRAGPNVPRNQVEARIARWRFLLQAIERRYLRRTPAMIFVSRWVRDRTLLRYGVRPRLSAVVPNAIDTEFLTPNGAIDGSTARIRSDSPTLLFAGRLLALKGIDTLLRAMARLDPRIRLVLAGPGDQGPWKALAHDLGLANDRIEFVGRVPYEVMPDLYHSVDAVVLPSYSESYPLVALEAMACGTPIIAAEAGGVPEIIQDGVTGWLFPAGDVEALVTRVEAVLADSNRANRASARARAWVEANASIERMAEQTFGLYERLVWGEAS